MKKSGPHQLGKRERQIMDVIYRRGKVSVQDVLDELDDPPSYSAVRAMLRILEDKGHLRHEQDGPRYLYRPTVPREQARESYLRHLVRTFFNGSIEQAVAALLGSSDTRLTEAELERLSKLIRQARKQGR
jgi:predicted transcriptional regulator